MFDLRMPLIGGTPAEAVLQELRVLAEKKENWWGTGALFDAPTKQQLFETRAEEGARYTRSIEARDIISGSTERYLVIFTISVAQAGPTMEELQRVLVRHATIHVDGDRIVDPTEVFTITRFLGFHDTELWASMHPDGKGVVAIEILEPEEEAKLETLKV